MTLAKPYDLKLTGSSYQSDVSCQGNLYSLQFLGVLSMEAFVLIFTDFPLLF